MIGSLVPFKTRLGTTNRLIFTASITVGREQKRKKLISNPKSQNELKFAKICQVKRKIRILFIQMFRMTKNAIKKSKKLLSLIIRLRHPSNRHSW